MSKANTKRPPLAERLNRAFEELEEWSRGERELKVTRIDNETGELVSERMERCGETTTDCVSKVLATGPNEHVDPST